MVVVAVFAFVCLQYVSGNAFREPHSSPEYLIVGKFSGEIWVCPLQALDKCHLFHRSKFPVTDTVVHGEYLYASYVNGVILKCHWFKKKRCSRFYRASSSVKSLVAADGFLYAGADKTLLLCKLNQPQSCSAAHKFDLLIGGLYKYDKFVYVATTGHLTRCLRGAEVSCQQIAKGTVIDPMAVSGWKNTVIILSWQGYIWTHTPYTSPPDDELSLISSIYHDMEVFKGNLYFLEISGKIMTCKLDEVRNCSFLQHLDGVRSISFVYSTYHMKKNHLESEGCFRNNPGMLFKYREEHRALLEVSVEEGKLIDARGIVVDTRSADQGYSGRAAVFAMGLDGQLFLSKAHRSGLVQISSFFAGNPVSSAGEIIVEDGVIKKIVACSPYYQPDVGLNRQVVDELYSRGYSREIELEECAYTCDRD